jgi:hypothetical protein
MEPTALARSNQKRVDELQRTREAIKKGESLLTTEEEVLFFSVCQRAGKDREDKLQNVMDLVAKESGNCQAQETYDRQLEHLS